MSGIEAGIGTPWLYGGFIAFVVAALAVDFVVLGKEGAHRVGLTEAGVWSAIWVALSLGSQACCGGGSTARPAATSRTPRSSRSRPAT